MSFYSSHEQTFFINDLTPKLSRRLPARSLKYRKSPTADGRAGALS